MGRAETVILMVMILLGLPVLVKAQDVSTTLPIPKAKNVPMPPITDLDPVAPVASMPLVSAVPLQTGNADAPYNETVVEAITRLGVTGGGYSVGSNAVRGLQSAVSIKEQSLLVKGKAAQPSFCSEATYLIFLQTISMLQEKHQINLSHGALSGLAIHGQPDGTGVWGCWNANGPGTARLFKDLAVGENFQELARAHKGDFMKIFWTDEIGAKEFGHSVIYMGHAVDSITIWSSNGSTQGYGFKNVPLTKIKRMLFSRLLHPEALESASGFTSDSFLASMLTKSPTEATMRDMVGIGP